MFHHRKKMFINMTNELVIKKSQNKIFNFIIKKKTYKPKTT